MEENAGNEGSSDKYLNLKEGLANAWEKDLAEVEEDVKKVDWKRSEMDESDTYIEKESSGTRFGETQPTIAAEIKDFSSKNNFLICNSERKEQKFVENEATDMETSTSVTEDEISSEHKSSTENTSRFSELSTSQIGGCPTNSQTKGQTEVEKEAIDMEPSCSMQLIGVPPENLTLAPTDEKKEASLPENETRPINYFEDMRKFEQSAKNSLDSIGDSSNLKGPMGWIIKQIAHDVDPKNVISQIMPGVTLPSHVDPMTLWKVVWEILTEPQRRTKLDQINTLDDVVSLIDNCRNIIVLTGAGVSVSCGIPDFRSRDGIYARLSEDFPDLPDPQSMFDIHYFRRDQRPFYKFAKEIYPGKFKPSLSHRFIAALDQKKKLLRNYTQNIDTLEQVAGIERVVQCHGSFATASCTNCKYQVTSEGIKDQIFNQVIPKCPVCPETEDVLAVMKPDIIFFGEGLPNVFYEKLDTDKLEADLLIVIGSSLKVRPVALLPDYLKPDVPQILINREPLDHFNFDVELLGNSDDVICEICRRLGQDWSDVIQGYEMPPLDKEAMYKIFESMSDSEDDESDDNGDVTMEIRDGVDVAMETKDGGHVNYPSATPSHGDRLKDGNKVVIDDESKTGQKIPLLNALLSPTRVHTGCFQGFKSEDSTQLGTDSNLNFRGSSNVDSFDVVGNRTKSSEENIAVPDNGNTCDQENTHIEQENTLVGKENTHKDQENTCINQGNTCIDTENTHKNQATTHKDQVNANKDQDNKRFVQGNTHKEQGNTHKEQGNTNKDQGNTRINQDITRIDQGNTCLDQGNTKNNDVLDTHCEKCVDTKTDDMINETDTDTANAGSESSKLSQVNCQSSEQCRKDDRKRKRPFDETNLKTDGIIEYVSAEGNERGCSQLTSEITMKDEAAAKCTVTALENEVIAQEGAEITPNEGVVTPKKADITPEDAMVTPRDAEITPEDAVITPNHKTIAPKKAVIAPENAVFTRVDAVVAPKDTVLTADDCKAKRLKVDDSTNPSSSIDGAVEFESTIDRDAKAPTSNVEEHSSIGQSGSHTTTTRLPKSPTKCTKEFLKHEMEEPNMSYLFVPPNRYVFHGAEINSSFSAFFHHFEFGSDDNDDEERIDEEAVLAAPSSNVGEELKGADV